MPTRRTRHRGSPRPRRGASGRDAAAAPASRRAIGPRSRTTASPPATTGTPERKRASDEAVRAATGKDWAEWFALLDRAGASAWAHREIAAHLHDAARCPGWWSQMVAVAYEQERGLRLVHQRPGGFEISRGRTIAAPVEEVFAAFESPRRRARWLADPGFTVRRATPAKSMRITWVDGATSVEVSFVPKGPAKAQITVQHGKLKDARAAERMKSYWESNLGRLKDLLET